METEPVQVGAAPGTPELKKSFALDDRERVIQSINELLSSGRSLSEVLHEAKRHAASSPSEPTTISEVDPAPSGATTLAARTQQEERPRFALARLTGRVPRWLATALCLTALAAAAGTAVLANLPTAADATSSAPTITSKPAIQPSIRTLVPSAAEPGASPEPSKTAQHLSAEQVTVLRARGDALVSMADVTAGRLFYERAVAAGDAQAALRLGATFDPLFLSRTGLQGGVRGDVAIATYWYRRARDLGAIEAETLLKSVETK